MKDFKIYKSFKGGIKFRNFLGNVEDKIEEMPLPKKVLIPLRQGFSGEVKPIVKIGDKVKAGNIIGIDKENVSTPICASISGTVKDIRRMNYFHQEVNFVIIEGDGSYDWEKSGVFDGNFGEKSKEEIEEKLYLSGVTSLGKAGIPTIFKSSIISPSDVENIIIHFVGSEVYNISLNTILSGKRIFNFIEGIEILNKIYPDAKIFLILGERNKKFAEEIRKLTANFNYFEVGIVEEKYPGGYDEILIPTILNKKFPYGYSCANIGIITFSVRDILHIYESIVESKPLIERIITIQGPSFKENIHLKVRIGTPLNEIMEIYLKKDFKSRIIHNSLLTGDELKDFSLPVDISYNHIIGIPDTEETRIFGFLRPNFKYFSYSQSLNRFSKKTPTTKLFGEVRPCIFCGYCYEVCPVRILPNFLSSMIKKNVIDERLMNYGIFNCIGCNLCSFVCPSKIPLSKIIKEGQGKLINQGCDRSLCILPYFELKGLEQYRGIK